MVILASGSPRRKELLKRIVEEFEVIPADIDETVMNEESPQSYAERMSRTKAAHLAQDYPEELILAADTIVAVDEKILGKPVDRKDAKAMLMSYSNRSHEVLTSVTLRQGMQEKTFVVTAVVEFYPMTDEEIESYLDHNEWQDKSGSYGIQGAVSLFVKGIKGDFFTIVGFPISRIYQELKEFGV